MKDNSKRFWSYVKHRKQDASGIAPLKKSDGLLYSDAPTQADILNKQFHSVYTREDTGNIPSKGPSPHKSMNKISISTNGVKKLLRGLNIHKATGPDQIPTRLLHDFADELGPTLSAIFQRSLDTGKIPDDWREAAIVPVFKKGDRHQASNYRPVSLTSVACKVLEHVIHSQIMDHFDRLKILTDKQHGFRSRRSCETQLIVTIDSIAKSLAHGEQVDIILLDFSKAFDKVPHQRLLHKLDFYGVRGTTWLWIKDFLTKRTQHVNLDGTSSSLADVISGVPQGTVLGPLLFLTYINDLPEHTESDVRLFADDALLYRKISSKADAEQLQRDLSALQHWEHLWQMEFHPQKCTVIHISNKRQPRKTGYTLHGHTLEEVDSAKYLGVTIHHKLRWNEHISNISTKANRTLGFIKRNLHGCKPQIKSMAYQTMVRPTLEYASTVWDPHHQVLIKTLEGIQRRAARFVTNNYRDRTPGCMTTMVQELNWETLQQRRKTSRLVMMYKIIHGLVDIDQSNYLTPGDSRTRGAMKFLQPTATREVYNNSYFPRTIRDWNGIPSSVRTAKTIEAFRMLLSTNAAACSSQL